MKLSVIYLEFKTDERNISLLILDLDHLKKVNDEYRNVVGDG